MKNSEFILQLKELCEGAKKPDSSLSKNGCLPVGWESEYLDLLSQNRLYWQNIEAWPRELFYCFYRVSYHHKYAYDSWLLNNKPNQRTETALHKIRLFTESFITGSPEDAWQS